MLIDKYADNWIDELDRWVGALADDKHLYLLIDGVFVPGLYRAVKAAVPTDVAPQLLFEGLPGCNDETRDVSPFVFPYTLPTLPGLRKALLRCDGWPMVHAIITPLSLVELAQGLAQWCIVQADEQRFNFRFADTRRLPGILNSFTLEQRAHFVGPALAWYIINRAGQWQAVGELPLAPATTPLDTRLNVAQFSALVDDAEADGILTIFQDRGMQWPGQHAAVYAVVAKALETAEALKLEDGVRVDWCEACLADATLLKHPQPLENLQRWLKQTQT